MLLSNRMPVGLGKPLQASQAAARQPVFGAGSAGLRCRPAGLASVSSSSTSSSRRRLVPVPRVRTPPSVSVAASRSGSPSDGDDSEASPSFPRSVDENPASSSQAAGSSSGALSQQQQQQQDSALLALPLLVASSLSHVNRQYIKMRRRRKWWKSLGGYPKVPSENMDHLPEPAIELWHKVVPLGLIFFCASFNLTILQSLKDAIVVTAGGAETLPFLAFFCVLPASLAFFVLYGKLVTHLPERAVFYTSVLPLLAYYGLFAAVLYPVAGSLHPVDLMNSLMGSVPAGLHGLLKVAGNWTYSLFFCMAELWGAVVISVLFWSLANEVCTVDEAKAVYPFMAIGANIALVAAGCFIRLVNHTLSTSFAGDTQLLSLRVLIGTVMAMTVAMFGSKAWIDAKILQPTAAAAAAAAASANGQSNGAAAGVGVAGSSGSSKGPKAKKKKSKGTFAEGLAVLKNSPKIRNLALLVMSYGVGHRLFEFAWKGQLRQLYPTVQGYQSVLADVATYTGMLTLASMVVSRLVFQYAGWGVAAAVTPAVMGLAGVVFFGATLAAQLPALSPEMAATVAGVGATAGVVTQVFARAAKYSLFDPAKEMVYIEMDADEKKQGKAAVDLVGSQIGKSGASWITQAFLLGCGSIAAAMPFTGFIFAGVIITWIKATLELHNQMVVTEKARLAEAAADAAAAAGPDATTAGAVAGGAAVTAAVAGAAAAAAAGANGSYSEPSTPASGSAMSSVDHVSSSESNTGGDAGSDSNGGGSDSNGGDDGGSSHHMATISQSSDLHAAAVRLSGGSTYSPSHNYSTDHTPNGSSNGGSNGGSSGSSVVRERSKVKLP